MSGPQFQSKIRMLVNAIALPLFFVSAENNGLKVFCVDALL
jgi:hypothetical protein